MPSIVPKNPAPVPQYLVNGTTIGPPAQTYGGTDWGRLGQRFGQWIWKPNGTTTTYTGPNGETTTQEGGENVWQGQGAALPPGFTQASIPSQYGAAWRGGAFGPSGRIGAPSEGWDTRLPPYSPYTDPNVNPGPLPPRRLPPPIVPTTPVVPNPKEIYKPVDTWPATGGATAKKTGWGF